jgi:PAS domain S-box-containing protein
MASDPLTRHAAGIALVGALHAEYGRVLRANQRLADLLTTPLADLEGTRICEHIDPQDRQQADNAYLRLMADPQGLYENTTRLLTGDGEVVRVHAVTSLIATRNGGAFVVRVVALDA